MNKKELEEIQNKGYFKRITLNVILSIITLGIYQIFWEYKMICFHKDLVKDEQNVILQTILCAIIPFYLTYKMYKIDTDFYNEFRLKLKLKKDNYAVVAFALFPIISAFSLGIMQSNINLLNNSAN